MLGQELLTSRKLLKVMRQEICCPICCSGKSTCTWRQLPCQHCFCEKCLERWYQTKQSESEIKSGELQMTRQLSCPFCRGCTTIPPEGIQAIPVQRNGVRKDLMDLMAFLKNTSVTSQDGHACALCPYEVQDISIKLFNFCQERNLTLCGRCQGRFPSIPSAPPSDEDLATTRWPSSAVWTMEATSNGRYSDAVVANCNGAISAIVCDSDKCRLLVFEINGGKCVLTSKTSYRPFCMAYDEGIGKILVTKYNSTSLIQLDVSKLKDARGAKKFKASAQPQGLARLEGGRTVVAETNRTIAIYDESATCVQRWRCDMQPQYVAAKDDIIVVSFRDDNCIVAFDHLGNRKWRVQLSQPRGVAVDKDRVMVVHEGHDGKGEVSLCSLKTGHMLGQLEVPPLDALNHHNQDRLIKVIPCEGNLLIVYNHFIRLATF